MKWWHVYLAVWAAAAVLGALLTWACRGLAPKLGLLDRPKANTHKLHGKATPVLGGLAMLVAWLLTIAAGLACSEAFGRLLVHEVAAFLPGIQTVTTQLVVIVLGAIALVTIGVIDDRQPMGAFPKFAAQFCIAGAVACWGVRVTFFWSQPILTWAITTFWILFIVNAINFLDNMDGLAAGIATIAAFFFAFCAAMRGQYFVAVLALTTCGTACGFLMFNRPPASIFMGDAGSHFLGYILAVIGALTTYYTPAESPTPAPVLIPVLILGIPIFDVAAVVLIRWHQGRPIYVGDHMHISHRFVRMGLSRAQAVLLVLLLVFAAGAGAVTLLWLPFAGTVLITLQTLAMLAIVSLLQFFHVNPDSTPEENTKHAEPDRAS